MWRRLMLKLSWQRLQNRLHLVANTAKIGPSGLMEKGLIVCLDLKFEYSVIGHGIVGKDIPIMARLAGARRWSKR